MTHKRRTTPTKEKDNGRPTRVMPPKPRDYRHRACGRLLFRAVLAEGTRIEIRCPKCGLLAVYSGIEKDAQAISVEAVA